MCELAVSASLALSVSRPEVENHNAELQRSPLCGTRKRGIGKMFNYLKHEISFALYKDDTMSEFYTQ